MTNISTLGFSGLKRDCYHGSENNVTVLSESHARTQETVVMEHKCNLTAQRLGFNLETYTKLKFRFGKRIVIWLDFRSFLDSDNKTCDAFGLWDHLRSEPI